MACEAICLKPKKSEDAKIFDVIFGHPLLPNVNKEMSKQVEKFLSAMKYFELIYSNVNIKA